MLTVDEFVTAKGRGFPRKGKEPTGSRRKVILSDGSVVKWWGGVWKFQSTRWNTKVSTSLNTRAMVAADEAGRMVVDSEVYTDFKKFMDRMVGLVGSYEFLRIVSFIQRGE